MNTGKQNKIKLKSEPARFIMNTSWTVLVSFLPIITRTKTFPVEPNKNVATKNANMTCSLFPATEVGWVKSFDVLLFITSTRLKRSLLLLSLLTALKPSPPKKIHPL